MGSGSSREKKISSGLQKEDHMYINNKERNGGDCDPKEEKRLYKSYKIQQLSDFSKSSNRSGLGCHSEGHDSDFSIDDDEDDIEGELDRVLAEYESRDFYSSRKHQNNSFLRSNTYSFCNSRQVYKESDFNSTPYIQKVDQMRTNKQTAFGLFGSKDVQHYDRVQMCEGTVVSPSENNIPVFNNRDTCSQNIQRNDSQKQGKTQDLKNNNLADILHSSSKNPAPVLYDGFEEELMSSIEREYS